MSIQWTIIAGFLYAEILVIMLLLIPFISAQKWQKVLKSKVLNSLFNQSSIYFNVFIVLLVLFFVDAIREMWKYSHELEDTKDNSHSHLDQEMQYSMKIFRAQRNFYISGFALFLCLVLKRLVTLISAQATLQASHDAALKQAKSATDTAQKLLADKEKSEAAIGDSAQNQDNDIREAHEKQVKEVSRTLKETQEELYRSRADLRSMKQQAESVSNEYDRLLKEHTKLQEIVEGSRSKEE